MANEAACRGYIPYPHLVRVKVSLKSTSTIWHASHIAACSQRKTKEKEKPSEGPRLIVSFNPAYTIASSVYTEDSDV